MPRFGKETHEKWPVGINNPVERISSLNPEEHIYIPVAVTRDPTIIQNLLWHGFRLIFGGLLPLIVVAILIYSGLKSATYTGDRAAAIRQDLGEIQSVIKANGEWLQTIPQTPGSVVSYIAGTVILLPFLLFVGWGIVSWIRFVLGWADYTH